MPHPGQSTHHNGHCLDQRGASFNIAQHCALPLHSKLHWNQLQKKYSNLLHNFCFWLLAFSIYLEPFPNANILLTMQWCLRRFRFPKGKQHYIYPLLVQQKNLSRLSIFFRFTLIAPSAPNKSCVPPERTNVIFQKY